MNNTEYSNKVKQLVDDLKGVFTSAGLGGEAGEYKLLTQSFLYKFINDKFLYEARKFDPKNDYQTLMKMSDDDYEGLQMDLGNESAVIKREDLIETLFNRQNEDDFSTLFDATLNDIAIDNNDIYSVETAGNTQVRLFDSDLIQDNVIDGSQRNIVARAIINKLSETKFDEHIFDAGFDFFSTIFEYMIKDYNKDGGGKYAEYYTPHSVAKIIANILVGYDKPENVRVYDPAAGSGTLLMTLASKIGTDRATVYSQDISQKSTNLLRMNLILNGLSHSIHNIVQGNTILHNKHTEKMDYIVSNPPFNLDFSQWRDEILTLPDKNLRFFAGVPNVPKKKKSSMSIYLLFIQHILCSMSDDGHAAIVVPSGFLTDTGSIESELRKRIIENKSLFAVVQMPTNVFATTNTSVSVIFIDKSKEHSNVMFVDASKLGSLVKAKDNTRVVLSDQDQQRIVDAITDNKEVQEFSTFVSTNTITDNDYMLKPGLYFEMQYSILANYLVNLSSEVEKAKQRKRGLLWNIRNELERNKIIEWFVKFNADTDVFSGEKRSSLYGEIPVEIELTSLEQLLDQTIGGEWGKASEQGNYKNRIKCIRGTDIPNVSRAYYDNVPTRYVLDKHIKEKRVRINDIIIEISGGSPIQSTGRICLITEELLNEMKVPVLCTNFCRILRLKSPELALYVYNYLVLLYDRGYFFNLENNTTGIKNLIFNSFEKNVKVPIPNAEVMTKFNKSLEKDFQKIII
ncbi:N-6 DNA methylase [Lactobacillus sp. RTP31084st1_D4_RTP31084_210423]|jgi:type I restriction enzyme M protein|uniref:N-6 DNA methylase n=1 Tax=unclassified Lactobacillus TaxID=2620435 RepID=UPI0034A35B07|nr:N-6 DNA methylase [Lactobacillus sp.]